MSRGARAFQLLARQDAPLAVSATGAVIDTDAARRRSAHLLLSSPSTVVAPSADTGTFAGFLAAMTRCESVLAWLRIRRGESGWTLFSGSVYSLNLPPTVGAAQYPGGVYAPVVAVIQNDLYLTHAADFATCNATPGSWYYHAPAWQLWVHTTGSVDPDTYTLMTVEREVALSTSGLVLDEVDGDLTTGRYYHPWILSDLSSILQEAEDVLSGRKLFEEGDLTIASEFGWLHALIAVDSGYTWENTRVRFALGGQYDGQTLPRSEYEDLGAMAIYRVDAVDDVSVTFKMRPLSAGPLVRPAQPTPIFSSEYPSLGDGVSGSRKPIGYGRGIIRPPLVNASGFGVYLLADASVQTLTRVHRVEAINRSSGARFGLTEGVDYSVDLVACTLTLLSAEVTAATHDLDVDVTGKPGGVRGYLSTFAEIVQDLLLHVGRVSSADIDAASVAAAQAAAPQELSVWLLGDRTLASVLSTSEPELASLERSVHGTVTIDRHGRWSMRVWQPPKDVTAAAVLRKSQIAGISFRHRDERLVVGKTLVYFAHNQATGAWSLEEKTDTRKQFLDQTRDELHVYTFLRASANAQALAQRYQLLFGTALMEADLSELGATTFLSQLHDPVLLTYAPAPTSSVAYTGRVFQFVRLERLYSPMVGIRAGVWDVDATGLARNGGVWMATGSPNYATAAAAQREASGFWTDANGDPGSGGAFVGRSRWV